MCAGLAGQELVKIALERRERPASLARAPAAGLQCKWNQGPFAPPAPPAVTTTDPGRGTTEDPTPTSPLYFVIIAGNRAPWLPSPTPAKRARTCAQDTPRRRVQGPRSHPLLAPQREPRVGARERRGSAKLGLLTWYSALPARRRRYLRPTRPSRTAAVWHDRRCHRLRLQTPLASRGRRG